MKTQYVRFAAKTSAYVFFIVFMISMIGIAFAAASSDDHMAMFFIASTMVSVVIASTGSLYLQSHPVPSPQDVIRWTGKLMACWFAVVVIAGLSAYVWHAGVNLGFIGWTVVLMIETGLLIEIATSNDD